MKPWAVSYIKRVLYPWRALIIPHLGSYRYVSKLVNRLCLLYLTRLFHKKKGKAKFSIISACYNIAPYITDFIESIVYQSLDFKENIQLILVDDGSTDNLEQLVLPWIKKFPNNIMYLKKKNGGQASARNVGIRYATNEWVCFADPDDFFDGFCFQHIDDFLSRGHSGEICAVSMHYYPYYEKGVGFLDNHPLSFKYQKGQTVKKVSEMDEFIQLATNSVVMKLNVIKELKLFFNEKCKPNFEDASFFNTYLAYFYDAKIAYLPKAKYFYRKRDNRSSTLDTSWTNPQKFFAPFKYGLLPLLNLYKQKFKKIPKFIQYIAIYECYWHIKKFLNNEEGLYFLTQEQKLSYLCLLEEVFDHIDSQIILSVRALPITEYYRIGILGYFKGKQATGLSLFVENFEASKSLIKISFISTCNKAEIYLQMNDGRRLFPNSYKVTEDRFLGKPFVYKHYYYFTLPLGVEFFSCFVNSIKKTICCSRETHMSLSLSDLYKTFGVNNKRRKRLWLVSDRDTQADDNGEHFYRYLLNNHPEVTAYFLLNKTSHDWTRLKSEGFRLVPYGSLLHRFLLKKCTCIISAHADEYVTNYFHSDFIKIPFVFLQHGVLHNDLSGWLNTKHISIFITSSTKEYDSIVSPNSRYCYSNQEVKLTGLPRHDSLLNLNNPEKLILVMPTWRRSICGSPIKGNERTVNKEFMSTNYARTWESFFNSKYLKQLVCNYSYKIIFFPHANVQPYIKYFKLPEYVFTSTHTQDRIQDLFGKAAILITDYSSVAFDFAYLKKPVLYYQFDEQEVFGRHSHIISKGSFDYRKDGLGEVVTTETDLCNVLEQYLRSNCKMSDVYISRVQELFPFRDGHCCSRVFETIEKAGF